METENSHDKKKNRNAIVRFWRYLQKDTWHSWIVSLILLIVLIRFILFPGLSFLTGSSLPLVVIESCSLYHESGFDEWWSNNGAWYEERGIQKSDFMKFPFRDGLNKGDIIFVWGRSDYKKGNIIIFSPNSESSAAHPIIHRIVTLDPTGTKGDHNSQQLTMNNNFQHIDETSIADEQIIGAAVFRIPFVGWLKLIFFEPFRPAGERGFCH
jgi:hypothetical protein